MSASGVWGAAVGSDDGFPVVRQSVASGRASLCPGDRQTRDEWVTALAFSPDGTSVAAGSYQKLLLLPVPTNERDSATREVRSLKFRNGFCRSLAFSRDGRQLAAGGYQRLIVYDLTSGSVTHLLKDHRAYVTGLSFGPAPDQLASSSEDETTRLWNLAAEGGPTSRLIGEHRSPVMDVAISPDGQLLATADGDDTRVTRPGRVTLWDAQTGELRFELTPPEQAATAVAFSPDGSLLAATSYDEKVYLYHTATGKPTGFFGKHARPTTDVVFLPTGGLVASGSGGRAVGKNEVKIWNAADGEEILTINQHAAPVTAVVLSPDGHWLATAGQDKRILLWDVSGLVRSESPAEPATANRPPAEAHKP